MTDCRTNLIQNFKDLLSEDELKNVIEYVETVKNNAAEYNLDFKEELLKDIHSRQVKIASNKKSALHNIKTINERLRDSADVTQTTDSKGKQVEILTPRTNTDALTLMKQHLHTTIGVTEKGHATVATINSRNVSRTLQPLVTMMHEEPTLFEMYKKSGTELKDKHIGTKLEKEVQLARQLEDITVDIMHDMGNKWKGKVDPKLYDLAEKGATYFQKIKDIAFVLKKSNSIDVAYRKNYLGPSRIKYDNIKDIEFDEYLADMRQWASPAHFKKDKAFVKAVKHKYNQAKARSNSFSKISDDMQTMRLEDSKAVGMAEQRHINFKDGASELAHAKKYGGNRNLIDLMTRSAEMDGRYLALVQKFGHNVNAGVRSYLQGMRGIYKDIPQDKWDMIKLSFMQELDVITGKNRDISDPNGFLNKSIEFFKLAAETKLSIKSTAQALLTDPAWNAISNWNLKSKSNFFSFFGEIASSYKQAFKSMTKKERIRIAHHINALAQEVITQGATVSKMLMEDIDDKGFIGWARKVNMNATLLREQSQGARLSNWFHKAELGAGERNLSFKDLKKATQMELSRSGINEKEWDIIRKRMITDHADGISVLDPNKFDSALLEASKNNDYNTIEKHRKIADSLYTFLHDQSHTWTPTAHTGIQAALQFASPNHPLGKIANTAAQFKSFPVASVVTLRRLYQQGLANNGVKGAALAMAQASTFLTLGGYLTLLASDAYNNRNPEDRLKGENAHTKLLAEALRAGGFGGIFADMAMSDFELSGRNLAETLVGPGLNMFSDFVGTGYGAVKDVIHSEEDEKMFKPLKITNLLSKNMPNTFGFKTLYNTFFNDILESLVDAEGTMQKAYRRQGLIESGIVQGKWFNPYE